MGDVVTRSRAAGGTEVAEEEQVDVACERGGLVAREYAGRRAKGRQGV